MSFDVPRCLAKAAATIRLRARRAVYDQDPGGTRSRDHPCRPASCLPFRRKWAKVHLPGCGNDMTSVCFDLVIDPGAGSDRFSAWQFFRTGLKFLSRVVQVTGCSGDAQRDAGEEAPRRGRTRYSFLSAPTLAPRKPAFPLRDSVLSCLQRTRQPQLLVRQIPSVRSRAWAGGREARITMTSVIILCAISLPPVSLSSCALQLRSLGRVTQRGNPRDTKKRISNGRNAGGGNAALQLNSIWKKDEAQEKKLKRDRAWKEGSKSLTCNA